MEVVVAAPSCQLLLIMLMAAMLLPGMKSSPLLVWRKIARTIKLQESIDKGFPKDVFISRKQEGSWEFENFYALSTVSSKFVVPNAWSNKHIGTQNKMMKEITKKQKFEYL
ncbi:hypothetical protein STEG23_018810 [Scotinomys teguina]